MEDEGIIEISYRIEVRVSEDKWLTSVTTSDPIQAADEFDALSGGPEARIVYIETVRSETVVNRGDLP